MRKFIGILLVVCLIIFSADFMTYALDENELHVRNQLVENKAAYVPDEILVRYKNDSKPFRVMKVPPGQAKKMAKQYNGKAEVEYAELNYYAHAYAEPLVPNDPYYDTYQWNLRGRDEGGINADLAWNLSTGSGVVVAVLDTGIAYENFRNIAKLAPDLSGTAFVLGYDFINNDNKPYDDEGHGTHVAGTIAQTTNNGEGVAGVAYDAALMPVKVLDSQGSGSYAVIAEGIYFAADNGADVINMSLGGPVSSVTLENALDYARNPGKYGASHDPVTIVAATGNDSGAVGYPAAYDAYVIAVGATDYNMNLAYYSNYGPEVDVVAPGGDVTVDLNNDGYGDGILQNTFGNNPRDMGYYFYQGTSMATPHVAGTAALMISNGNATTPDQVQRALQDTAHERGEPGKDNLYGYGLIDAYAALGWTDGPQNDPPMVQVVQPSEGAVITGMIDITAEATDDDMVTQVEFYVNGISIGIDEIAEGAQFSVTWDSTSLADGPASIVARATDNGDPALTTDSDPVSIEVDNIDGLPSVTIRLPVAGSTVSGNVTITADAFDDRGVQQVEFFVEGSSIGVDEVGEGDEYSIVWDSSGIEYGTVSIGAIVVDNGDPAHSVNSEPVNVTVSNQEVSFYSIVDVSAKKHPRRAYVNADATVTVMDGQGTVANILVEGQWLDNGVPIDSTVTGTTGADGTVVFNISKYYLNNPDDPVDVITFEVIDPPEQP